MTELTCFNWKYSKKTRKLSKNDKFVTNKIIFLILLVLPVFMKVRLNFQLMVFIGHVIHSEKPLNESKKWYSTEKDIGNMPQSDFVQF